MQFAETVGLDRLHEKRFASILCYPRYNCKEAAKRARELSSLGVIALNFTGEKNVFDIPVLGKGCVGVVVQAHVKNELAAMKIRRVDADRVGMWHEAEMLQAANKAGVGPRLIGSSQNFLLMELFEGSLLPKWLEGLKGRGTRNRIRQVLRDVLEQCWRLDETGLDHGELSRAPKHVIIDSDDKPHLLDFETASVQRRVSNVTAMCQFLFVASRTAMLIRRKLPKIDQESLRTALRNYKLNRTRDNFHRILSVCTLFPVGK